MTGGIVAAIRATPQRLLDAWLDPVRRKHTISRILESVVPALLVTSSWWRSALIVALTWIFYEWVLEPLGASRNPFFSTGHYWERGPRDDEIFRRT